MRALKVILIGVGIVVVVLAGGFAFLTARFGAINVPQQARVQGEDLQLTLPEGFSISTYAEGVVGARVIIFDQRGVMLVSETSEGKVVALPDTNNDGKADAVEPVASGLSSPHGLEMRCEGDACRLYVAEEHQLVVFDYDLATRKASNKKKLLDLPSGGGHSTRSLIFLPAPQENKLLISAGSSCNVCKESDERRAAVIQYDIGSGKSELFATGLRNATFMALHPISGKVFTSEMGRDGLGDDVPPDEINIVEKGKDYGWPLCYGKNIHDTNFDKSTNDACAQMTPSHVDLQAHSAPLGIAFIPEEGWDAEYHHDALVAYHGSWNRSVPTGYKVVRIQMDAQGKYLGTEDFLTGFLRADGTRIGRPSGIAIMPGGVAYVADDSSDKIYRIQKD